jgi:hypoxanthine phosphoribosyltransferase
MFNVLYSASQISDKVIDCALFIDNIASENDVVLCVIQQSSFMFMSDVAKQLQSDVYMDFCGVNRYDDDGTAAELYMYKGADARLVNNRVIIVADVLCNTGTTLDFAARLLKQMGAVKVYTLSLLVRQFSVHKPDWKGFTISDEHVYGYGIDKNQKYRTLPFIAYE